MRIKPFIQESVVKLTTSRQGVNVLVYAICATMMFTQYALYVSTGDPLRWWCNFFADDTFYYIKTVNIFVETGMVSFDGINLTNGVQPLWFALLAVLRKFSGEALFMEAALYMCCTLYFINAILLAILTKYLTRSFWWGLAAQVFFMANILNFKTQMMIMENVISFTVLALVFIQISRGKFFSEKMGSSGFAINTLLLTLSPLCRLDYFVIVVFLAFVKFMLDGKRIYKETIAYVALPASAMLVLALVNHHFFGHFEQIAGFIKHNVFSRDISPKNASLNEWIDFYLLIARGQLKTIFPIAASFFSQLGAWDLKHAIINTTLIIIVLNVAARLLAVPVRGTEGEPNATQPPISRHQAALIIVSAVVVRCTTLIFYIPASVHGTIWYYSVEVMVLFSMTAYVLSNFSTKIGLRGAGLAATFFGAAILSKSIDIIRHETLVMATPTVGFPPTVVKLMAFADATLPHDAIIGSWNSGGIGYFSHRRTINLDGLVNNFEYYKEVIAQPSQPVALAAYVKKINIRYFSDFTFSEDCSESSFTEDIRHGRLGATIDTLGKEANFRILKIIPTGARITIKDNAGRGNKILCEGMYLAQVR